MKSTRNCDKGMETWMQMLLAREASKIKIKGNEIHGQQDDKSSAGIGGRYSKEVW